MQTRFGEAAPELRSACSRHIIELPPRTRLPSPSAASVDAPSLVTDKHQNDRSVLALTAGAVFGGGEPRCLSPILYLSFNLLIYYMY